MSLRDRERQVRAKLSVAVTLAAFFTLCWLASVLPLGTGQPTFLASLAGPHPSFHVLLRSVGWSLAFGLGATLFALAIFGWRGRSE